MASGGNKSEKPTLQRLKKAREQGQFLSAREMLAAAQFIAAIILLSKMVPNWIASMRGLTIELLEHALSGESMNDTQWLHLLHSLLIRGVLPVLFVGGALFAVCVSGHLAITQMGFSLKKLTPDLKRFNPMSRLKDMPGQNFKGVMEGLLLIVALGLAINAYYQANEETLLRLPFQPVVHGSMEIGVMLQSLLWKASGLFVVFGAVDLFRNYRKHMSSLKMSKEEIKQEYKQNEGDPQVRGRIKRLRRDLLRRQMMKEVPTATAVIVNPTHYAVAIKYDAETMPCPVVVAKGKNWLALRIRQVATQHEVPIIENPPLARGLYGAIDVGRAVPPEFYRAMAEILAYIYKLMGRNVPGSTR